MEVSMRFFTDGTTLLQTATVPGQHDAWISPQQLLFILGIVIVTFTMLRSVRKKLREPRNEPHAYTKELYQRIKEEKSAAKEVNTVMLELEQLARHINGQIDTRFAKLETAIRDADQRIDRLGRLLRETRGEQTLNYTVDDRNVPKQPSPSSLEKTTVEPSHKHVIELSQKQYNTLEIAQKTDKTVGEVELILALHKTRTDKVGNA